MRLSNRGIVVTGASQGLGRAIAEACLAEGADLLLCSRTREDLERTAQDLRAKATPGQRLLWAPADVSDPAAVDRLFEMARADLRSLDGLVNNAGVYGPKGRIEDVDLREWTAALHINLLGTLHTCRAVLPHFRRQGRGRIVNLSGGGASAPLPFLSAYAASKAAVVRLTETLAEELRGTDITVNAVAPGALNTRLLDEVLQAGPDKVGAEFHRRAMQQKADGGAPLSKGAALVAFLLSDAGRGITGRLISAVWDPWTALEARREELARTDVYTLRRIVPEDRGLNWGKP